MSSEKLQSLQGLRGIAILLVLAFHLFPKSFVNGFVGVDMFFVLSGYLITRILSKSRASWQDVLEFYRKRFIRIVPMYYMTVLGAIIGVLLLVLRSERADFIYDLSWSLPLISNIQPIFEHHTYWQQVSSIRYLTHLWSLCTELQYYLIAPIIQWIASNLSFPNRILGYSVAILILFTFQLFAPFEYSYCFLAARTWQFLLGSVAFELGRRGDTVIDLITEKGRKRKKLTIVDLFPVVFMGLLVVFMAMPWIFGENVTRFTMSLSTALLCLISSKLEKSAFTLRPLVFLGDISYVMYLIHWPVINFVRYIQQRDHESIDYFEAVICVVIILVSSVFAHYFLERKLLDLPFPSNFTSSFFLLALSYSLIPWLQNHECYALKTLPADLQEHVQFNLNTSNILVNIADLPCHVTEKNANFSIDLFGIEYCEHQGTGNGTIFIIGNSISIRAFPIIFKLLNGRYGEIRLFAKHGGAPLFNIFDFYTNAARDMAEEMKPDLLWIIQGVKEITFPENPRTTYDPDILDQIVSLKMEELKHLAKNVYIDLPYFITKDNPSKLIARSLIYGKHLDIKLSVPLEKVEEQIGEQTERLLGLNCSNCFFNDVQKALINGSDKYYLYEPNSYKALNYDGDHLSLTGLERIKPIYKQRIEQFLRG